MTPKEADELIRGLGDDTAEDWIFAARDAQLPPSDLSWCWLFLGGRGAGKSHSMSAAVHTAVRAGIKRIHFIAPTTTDFHDVNVEGKSGIFATCGRDPRPRWVSSRRRLEWPNGAMCVFFSGEEPESLRGPEAEIVVIDEIARMLGILRGELEQRRLIAELYLLSGLVNMHDLVHHLEQRGFAVEVDVVGLAALAPAAIEQNFGRRNACHRWRIRFHHDTGQRFDGRAGV